MSANKFTAAHISGPFNSTHFTDCCGVAVLREDTRCPRCAATVIARHGSVVHPVNCGMCGKPRARCYC